MIYNIKIFIIKIRLYCFSMRVDKGQSTYTGLLWNKFCQDFVTPVSYTHLVPLKQKIEDWQSSKTVSIAGYSQTVGMPDTVNWKGVPTAGGNCNIYFDKDGNIVFDWGGENVGKKYPFNTEDNPRNPLENSGLLQGTLKDRTYFEIDSNAKQNATQYSPLVQAIRDKIETDSLLYTGTWAYYKNADKRDNYYLFWTSVDTNTVEAGNKIPVIISTADNKYYISETIKMCIRDRYQAVQGV